MIDALPLRYSSVFGLLALTACVPGGKSPGGVLGGSDRCNPFTEADGLGDLDVDGDGALTDADLQPGESALRAVWTNPDGSRSVGLHHSTESKIVHGDGLGQQDRWALWFRVDCDPEASAFVWFRAPEDNLEVDDYGVTSLNWDIPALEQWEGNEEAEGTVSITEVDLEGFTTSGYLSGSAGDIELWDALAAEPTGELIHIESAAFNSIHTELH